MEIQEKTDYNIFSALVETIKIKDRKKLRFAKCKACGRLTPFRLKSIKSIAVKCKKCGNQVSLGSNN